LNSSLRPGDGAQDVAALQENLFRPSRWWNNISTFATCRNVILFLFGNTPFFKNTISLGCGHSEDIMSNAHARPSDGAGTASEIW
jgi:hypothetical protein